MKTISRTFYDIESAVIFFFVVPLFYFLFVLLYNPYGMSDFLAAGHDRFNLNLIITSLTLLGVMFISRMFLFLVRKSIDLNWSLYVLWCFGEVIFAGMMFSIPLGIGWAPEHPYFNVMLRCVLDLAGIVVYPLAICTMAVQLYVLSGRVLAVPVDEKKLVRFVDEQKKVKLIASADSVLYIECKENYVHIAHIDNGKVKDFTLRSSMRSLDELMTRHGLVRCHRSFYVNPTHVELVKKDVSGYALAQLDVPGVKQVPVSKRYYDATIALL